tara:strand:+ start:138 stop:404 length:267 start_codon:yes stop_codon:yes gene_type:complete
MNITSKMLIETLVLLGGKKDIDDSVSFIKPKLVIKHKKAGIKYTVRKVKFNKKTKKPHVICYRYISPNSKRKIYIKIKEKDFNKFKPV